MKNLIDRKLDAILENPRIWGSFPETAFSMVLLLLELRFASTLPEGEVCNATAHYLRLREHFFEKHPEALDELNSMQSYCVGTYKDFRKFLEETPWIPTDPHVKEETMKKNTNPTKRDALHNRDGIRYFYLRDERYNPFGVVAYKMEGDTILYSVSVAHPNDGFNKKIGRDIATVRLNKGAPTAFCKRTVPTEKPAFVILKALAHYSPHRRINLWANTVKDSPSDFGKFAWIFAPRVEKTREATDNTTS